MSKKPDSPIIPAELVPAFRNLFSHQALAQFGNILQVEIVLDASVVIGDLLWVVRRRRTKSAKTNLQEVLTSETVIATAPTYLETEIAAKLPIVAKDQGVSLASLQAAWEEYKRPIRFEECGDIDDGVEVDPKDAPYIRLHRRTGRPVYSRDEHFHRMGAAVIDAQVVVTLRNYSRSASVEFAVKAGAFTVTGVGIAVVAGLWKAGRTAFEAFRKMPPSIQLTTCVALIAALVHPKSRQMLQDVASTVAPPVAAFVKKAMELSAPFVEHYHTASKEAADLRANLAAALPVSSESRVS